MEKESPARSARAVFDVAHEISSAAERKAYLDEACANAPDLRREVDGLLIAFEEAGSRFLETPAQGLYETSKSPGEGLPLPPPGTVDYQPEPAALSLTGAYKPAEGAAAPSGGEGPGAQIGPYTLVEKLGEGGMGTVWLAEQTQPVRRRVALKIIKAGMDRAHIIARFEAERQALNLMDHPSIARFLDAGATDHGLPFFVMELVPGVPMTRFCNENRLTVRERLELFTAVCQAVQHAHQKGIIHRDLKPGNVLVARQDGRAIPKVIDFGLAKAVEEPLTDHSVMTQIGNIVGTYAYMSPEQADITTAGVDTRTDVYSLGVMLYELLTGVRPMIALPADGLLEILRKIKEEEPVRPSAQVAGLDERLATIAEHRGTVPTRLAKLLRGELDWITLKALEKDRDRRFQTPSALADDLRRYLDDEPVEACPPSVRYRVAKFARKHRALVGVVAGFVAMLMLGIVGLTIGILLVNKAWGQEADARKRAEKANMDTVETLNIVANVVRSVASARSGQDTLQHVRGELIESGRVLTKQDNTPEGRKRTAMMHLHLANSFAILFLNDESADSQRQAITTYQGLVDDFPKEAQYRIQLARGHFNLAFFLAQLPPRERKAHEAAEHYRQAIALYEQLAADFPEQRSYQRDQADALNNLGVILGDQGELGKAEESYRAAVALGENIAVPDPGFRPNLAAAYHNLANAVRDQGKPEAALSLYTQAVDLVQPIDPRPEHVRIVLRNVCWDRANALDQLGRHKEASEEWETALVLEGNGQASQHLPFFRDASLLDAKLQSEARPAGGLLYQAATAHARAVAAAMATDEPGLQQRHTRLALELLEKARTAGWFRDPQHVQQLREDRAFDTLPRDAFQPFLASLGGG